MTPPSPEGPAARDAPTLRTELRPGDLGRVAALHGELYADSHGWDHTFEAYVAESLAAFARRYDPAADRLWLAERDGRLCGCIGIVAAGAEEAQLRWFLVAPDARGAGLGTRLLREAIGFCAATGRHRVFLWTTSDLPAAARLYAAAGFRRVQRATHEAWGTTVTEEKWVLEIGGA